MTYLKILAGSIALLLSPAMPESHTQGWRGIVPLHSTRSDVERLLGSPKGKYERYQIENEEATIRYSKGECVEGWKVPRDTVISIAVSFKQRRMLSDQSVDLSKYEKFSDPHVTSHTYYSNRQEGVMYVVFEGKSEDRGEILDVYYQPTSEDEKLLLCSHEPRPRLASISSQAQGWRGLVPLHSNRADVERLLGPPSESTTTYSVFYRTDKESVTIVYARGLPCGIGAKYSQWRVPRNTVQSISVTLLRPVTLSSLGIDERKYKKTSGGHRPQDIYYIKNEGGESMRVFGGEVQDIDYYPASADYAFACPGFMPKQESNCEGLTPPHFDFYGNINFGDEKARLDNFVIRLMDDKDRTGYIISYSGKHSRAREAKTRAERAKNYLVTVRHFPADRLKAIDGGYREDLEVELYVVPKGICPPSPTPTLDPRDVKRVSASSRGRRSE